MSHDSAKGRNIFTYISFIVICIGYLFVLVPRFALAVNADKIAGDFNLIPSALGILASAYFWTYALTQAPSGFIADKLAPEILIMISLVGITFADFMFAFATNFNMAIVSRLLTGLMGSLVYVPALRFTATYFPDNFALFTSLVASVNGLCVIMVNGPMVAISEKYGWRAIFTLSGWVCIGTAVILFGLYRMNRSRSTETKNIQTKAKQEKSSGGPKYGFVEVFKNKLAWPMFTRIFLTYGVNTSFQSLWAGPYMMGVLNMSRAAAGRTLALMSVAQLFSGPIGGYLADNVIKTRRLMVSFGVLWSALCWVPLVFFVDSLSPTVLTLTLCAMAFGGGVGAGAQLAQVREVYPPEAVGAAMGVNNTFLILGGAVLPAIFGFVIGSEIINPAKQFSNAFLLNLVCVLVAAVASFMSVETYGKSYEELISKSNRSPAEQSYN